MSDVLTATAPAPLAPRRSPVPRPGRPRTPARLAASGPSHKVRKAVELMIFGAADALPMKRQDAAKAVGLSDITLRQAFRNPLTIKLYNETLEVLRTSERPASVQRIAHLRDKSGSERVQLDAAKYLDGGDKASGVTVNVGISANIAPGYQVAIPSEHMAGAQQLLHLARSTRNVLGSMADVPTDATGTRE